MTPTPDPFRLLGLEPRFLVDPVTVRRRWRAESARLHPDLAGDDAGALATVALLNDAKETLLDDERRANALLTLVGGASKEADASLPDGFLMEIMDLRMAIESGDAEEVAEHRADAEVQRAGYVERVAALFESLGNPPAPDRLAEIRQTLNAWRYIERLLEQVE
ncbi:MAG: iron-sulfur cluster co-chaperone HscB C-terminal domain-containing protein [Planctomycetota bacterium]